MSPAFAAFRAATATRHCSSQTMLPLLLLRQTNNNKSNITKLLTVVNTTTKAASFHTQAPSSIQQQHTHTLNRRHHHHHRHHRHSFATSSANSQQSTAVAHKSSNPSDIRHILSMSDLSRTEIIQIIKLAQDCRHVPTMYSSRLHNKSLVMLFEKPSLRTRLSFEIGMTQLGGHAVYYELGAKSNLGGKETIEDTARVIARYADIIMARVNSRKVVTKLAEWSSVPVINALDDWGHPCQILADVQTIVQKHGTKALDTKRKWKIAFLGDTANNVTYDWMRVAAILGWEFRAAGPKGSEYAPDSEVVEEVANLCLDSKADVTVGHNAEEAVRGADVVMTDSWQSYHLDKAQQERRFEDLEPFRVTSKLMSTADPQAIFMHCLPASRGAEVEAEVIDGPQSIVFDQAENRLHAQKALMLFLLQDCKEKETGIRTNAV